MYLQVLSLLKLKTIHKCFLPLFKADLDATLHCIARRTGTWERGISKRRENVIYRDQSLIVQLLLQLENKQQIMQNNVDTQHKHMYSLYW